MALVLKTIEVMSPGANKIRGSEEVRGSWRCHKLTREMIVKQMLNPLTESKQHVTVTWKSHAPHISPTHSHSHHVNIIRAHLSASVFPFQIFQFLIPGDVESLNFVHHGLLDLCALHSNQVFIRSFWCHNPFNLWCRKEQESIKIMAKKLITHQLKWLKIRIILTVSES